MSTEIANSNGQGPMRESTEHWWQQRLTAGGNLFLATWFIASLAMLPDLEHGTIAAWLSGASGAVPMILLVISVFWHFRLGLQVVIEDYEKGESRIVMMVLLNYLSLAAGVLAVFSVLKIAFTGSAD